jgi:hypothetical protein
MTTPTIPMPPPLIAISFNNPPGVFSGHPAGTTIS